MSQNKQYECVSVIATTEKDPTNDRPEGHLTFLPGRHFRGADYEVMTDDGGVETIETETVVVIELPDLMSDTEAVSAARERAKHLVELAPSPGTDPAEPETEDDSL